MPTKQSKSTTRTPLTERILAAAPGIKVAEIVDSSRMARLPSALQRFFGNMEVEWATNRAWGSSFQLGATTVTLGHRRGDHLATYPWLYDFSATDAERLLRLQLEGTLLHELGHAVFDSYLRTGAPGYREAAQAALTDGAPSAYRGQDVSGMDPDDVLHEMVAEAFRYWCHHDNTIQERLPNWMAFIDRVVSRASTTTRANTRDKTRR